MELVVDRVPFSVGWLAKPDRATTKTQIKIRTSSPDRHFLLSIGDSVALTQEVEGPADGTLDLTAAALLRLVYRPAGPRPYAPGHDRNGYCGPGRAAADLRRDLSRRWGAGGPGPTHGRLGASSNRSFGAHRARRYFGRK